MDFVQGLFQLRRIVEPAAAEIAAQSRSEGDLTIKATALETIANDGLDSEPKRTADASFHDIIFAATRNDLLVSLAASIAVANCWTAFARSRHGKHSSDPLPA